MNIVDVIYFILAVKW